MDVFSAIEMTENSFIELGQISCKVACLLVALNLQKLFRLNLHKLFRLEGLLL